MSTAQFHRMRLDPTERTPIQIIVSKRREYCTSCHRWVNPNVIITKHLSSSSMDVCPCCRSVIQKAKATG